MNLSPYLQIDTQVSNALQNGRPVVALDTAWLTYLPPEVPAAPLAMELQRTVLEHGAVPAMMAVVKGILHIGIAPGKVQQLCDHTEFATPESLPVLVSRKSTAVTGVAVAAILASMTGISIIATPAIGGVRGIAPSDVSADLVQLCRNPVTIVSAGFKAVISGDTAVEYLEANGVPVLTLGSTQIPSFLCGVEALPARHCVQTLQEAADIATTKRDLGLVGGTALLCAPAVTCGLNAAQMSTLTQHTLATAAQKKIGGRSLTPHIMRTLLHACPNGPAALQAAACTCAQQAASLARLLQR